MRKQIFADESGNFDFSGNPSASRYFILTTALVDDVNLVSELRQLRETLAWRYEKWGGVFHATEDPQAIRNQVFETLKKYEFRIDATILDKRKTMPRLRPTEARFYKYAWFYHMKYLAPKIASMSDELLVVAAAVFGKKVNIRSAIRDVIKQTSPIKDFRCVVWPAGVDIRLQIADYCCWAIQRKWERGDSRSYDLIKDKIRSEYNLFGSGSTLYY